MVKLKEGFEKPNLTTYKVKFHCISFHEPVKNVGKERKTNVYIIHVALEKILVLALNTETVYATACLKAL